MGKIKNLQKRWTSLVQTRSVVSLFTLILIHKNNTFLHKRSKVDGPQNILEKADVANVNGLNDKLITWNCSKLTVKEPEQLHRQHIGFLSLTLSYCFFVFYLLFIISVLYFIANRFRELISVIVSLKSIAIQKSKARHIITYSKNAESSNFV